MIYSHKYIYTIGSGGVPMFEPRQFTIGQVGKIIEKLRRIYQEKSDLFDILVYAQKQY